MNVVILILAALFVLFLFCSVSYLRERAKRKDKEWLDRKTQDHRNFNCKRGGK